LINEWLKFNHSLFPQSCLLCLASKSGAAGICKECQDDLPWHRTDHCPQCALTSFDNAICGHCLAAPSDFDSTHALLKYEYPLDRMLQRYKYGHHLAMADSFAHLFIESLTKSPSAILPDVIIPMPLHPQRLKERGFNQSLEIARIIARRLNIHLDPKSCARVKLSPPQASLPLKERVKNMKGAFHCNESMNGLRIALLDDVMTTGASLNALAKTVKAAGASYVECWVIARTLPR